MRKDLQGLILVGDTHGSLACVPALREVREQYPDDLIIQVGDYGWWPGRDWDDGFQYDGTEFVNQCEELNVKWFPGNHEDYHRFPEVGTWGYMGPAGSEDHFSWFGGAVSVDQHRRTKYVSWFPEEAEMVAYLDNLQPRKLMLAHDAPFHVGPLSNADQTIFGVAIEAQLIDWHHLLLGAFNRVQPEVVVHGHWHMGYAVGTYRCTQIGLAICGQPQSILRIADQRNPQEFEFLV